MKLQCSCRHERKAARDGFQRIAGIDEAGRGPLAGPVVAAAVILPRRRFTCRIDDSKKLTDLMRRAAFAEITEKAIYGIGIVDESIIDEINIYRATALAMERAVMALPVVPDCLLIDGVIDLRFPGECRCIIAGDALSMTIAAASIIAKVSRDNIMMLYNRIYPKYGFARHKGYGTKEHFKALKRHGPSPIHRRTFAPVCML